MKVVGYLRVSTKEQSEQGFSLDAQREHVERFCQERGHDLVQTFTDVESGSKEDRREFQEMLAFVRKRPTVEGIVAWRLDRLTRNFRSYVELDDLKRKLLFVIEDYPANAHGRLILGIKVSLARHFLEALGENTSMGMERKARQGWYPSTAPAGYLNRSGRIIPDPLRAPLIRELFEQWAHGGHSLDSLRDWASENGLRQPRSGKALSRSRVQRLLSNPVYYGDFEWKGRRYAGKHEGVVPKSLWDEAQRILKQRERARRCVHDFPFRGLVHCSCGSLLTGQLVKGRWIYYACSRRCGGKTIREEKLATLCGRVFEGWRLDEEMVDWLRHVLTDSQHERKHYVRERTMRLSARYQTLQNALDAAYEDRVGGVIPEDLFVRKSASWRSEMAGIEEELEKLRGATEAYYEHGLELLKLAQVAHARYLAHSDEKKAAMLRAAVSNLTFDGVSVVPTYRKPFDVLAELAETKDWRPQRESNPCRRRERAVS